MKLSIVIHEEDNQATKTGKRGQFIYDWLRAIRELGLVAQVTVDMNYGKGFLIVDVDTLEGVVGMLKGVRPEYASYCK